MKKMISFCLSMIICFYGIPAVFAEYNANPRGLEQDEYESIVRSNIRTAINGLSDFDIVRDPFEKWSKEDPIKRRNTFEMVYLVRNKGERELWRLQDIPDWFNDYMKSLYATDVEPGTYDYVLLYFLTFDPLLRGRVDAEGNPIAALDEPMTYYEALAAVYRLFTVFNRLTRKLEDIVYSWDDAYPYYRFAQEIGLINSNTLVNYSTLTVEESKLNEPIPAYEFMYLLYTALYIPTFPYEDYGGIPSQMRYVDYFTKPSPWEMDESDYDEEYFYIP